MDRRDFLKIFSVGTVAAMSGELVYRPLVVNAANSGTDLLAGVYEDVGASASELARSIEYMTTPAPSSSSFLKAFNVPHPETGSGAIAFTGAGADTAGLSTGNAVLASTRSPDLHHYLEKMAHHERNHLEDVFLGQEKYPVLISTFKRLDRVQDVVGHGNFNIVSFDETLEYASKQSKIGAFTASEKKFLEELFSANASQYGFLGEKVITSLTAAIPGRERTKVARTGHYLYRGHSEKLYEKLRNDLGDSIVLTSGIRSVVKQMHLFLAKTIQSKGNLSKASRSLAPPGHSYHGVGDFDVGKVGFGKKNFTEEFASTDEFKRLVDLGYVDIRYHRDNLLGVRYEPWHIKVS